VAEQNLRKNFEILRSQLALERSSFEPQWRELAENIYPRRIRLSNTDTNRGDRRNQKIIDSTPTLAARTLRAGMQSGMTSPARPWFKLSTPDPDLAEFQRVKDYLDIVTKRISTAFLKSNLYNALPVVYGDIGVFGTAALFMEEDFEQSYRFYPFPIGQYYLANDERLRVNVFVREFRMTVRQLVRRFGQINGQTGSPDWSNISVQVKQLWDRGLTEAWVDIVHVIQPNDEYDPRRLHSKYKRFRSCYYEMGSCGGGQASSAKGYMGSQGEEQKLLSEKGYDFFPVLCPRWEITGEDVYGSECPGMQAIGDSKALQLMRRREAQVIEKIVNPPMKAPTTLRNQPHSSLPGDTTYVDEREGQGGFRPVHEVQYRISELRASIEDHQRRVDQSFYKDLFLMLANDERSNITATEIAERKEEKLLALGPVLEQVNQDMLDPLIDNAFAMGQTQGMFPEPPEELRGIELRVDYISVMHQAQKLVSLGSIERLAQFAGQIAATNPEAQDKIDTDEMIDVYGETVSAPHGIIRSDEQVAAIRQGRAQQQQQQAAAEQMAQGAQAAKTLSETKLDDNSALGQLASQANAGSLV
jgi:hypothetical protein